MVALWRNKRMMNAESDGALLFQLYRSEVQVVGFGVGASIQNPRENATFLLTLSLNLCRHK